MYRNKHKLSLELPVTQDTADNDLEGAPFVSVQNLVNIKQGKLCLPDDRMHIAFVQKKEKNSTASEIKIYRLIASNNQSAKKAILRPIFYPVNGSSLLFPFLKGGNLDLLQFFLFEQFKQSSTIAISWVMKQLKFLLQALHHLHTEIFLLENDLFQGIIHGDIKPSNILLNEMGNLVLADFDCAYPAARPAHQFGSLRYMAPELFADMNFTKAPLFNIDKSDIWSLGISLHRLLNNKFPDFFNNFTYNQKSSTPNFFQEKILDKNNYCTFFKDNICSFIDLKKWGENYTSTFMAKNARKSLGLLQHNKEKNIDRLTPLDILSHLSIAMLGSIEDRPNTEALLTLMQALQKHFCPTSDNKYQQFITELLKHSPLNSETEVNKNLHLETEPKNKKNRSFS
jgi:serine/threonine protein kinase